MNGDCLKLTTYFGERDRANGGFLADALTEIYARHELQTSLVLRGMEGFGLKQHLRTDRLLTLSEDLPLVSVAVDTRRHIEAVLTEVNELRFGGLLTLERAVMVTRRTERSGSRGRATRPPSSPCTWAVRSASRARPPIRPWWPSYTRRASRAQRSCSASTAPLTASANARSSLGATSDVPLMVIAVGDTARNRRGSFLIWTTMLARPLLTLERVRVCKRDGELLAEPRHLPERDDAGLGVWQKLMVYTGEQAHVDGQPLHAKLVRDLRAAGAAGATSLRGIWGYHGDHEPHGDSLWQLRRRVPIVTVLVDTPERIRTWFTIIDQLTRDTGLVTSEMVPAYRATTPGRAHGGLRLARGLTRE